MYRVGKSNILMLLQEERDIDYMYSKKVCRVPQIPHQIHTTPRVASVTVTLTADRIHVNNLERGFVEHLAYPAI
jgi:hypothetical protein